MAILAGGAGTRLIEETSIKPKPMVEIGGRPVLWHVMMYYSYFNFNEFVIALGYKSEFVKNWMRNYYKLNRDMTIKTGTGEIILHDTNVCYPEWTVHLVDTGRETLTGGRIKRLAPWIGDETFMLTWCDGLADIDLNALLKFHRSHGRLATLTVVRPPSRFGHVILKGDEVETFEEKPQKSIGWINGAYFVLEPEVFNYIENDDTQWEKSPLERLASEGQLMAYRHNGFWQCMDTLHEKLLLEKLWQTGNAKWKKWSGTV